jgi:beta-lactamase regulating signal transducer with metallopeptidase domain
MKFKFMDPQQIISVVVSLIVLAVGIFAYFTTTSQTSDALPNKWVAGAGSGAGQEYNTTYKAIKNSSATAGQVFNIVGIVIMIGAIMSIIGIIYSYLRPY